MRQPCERARLFDERRAGGIACAIDPDDLDRDLAIELHVIGLEDQAHAAAADALEHREASEHHWVRGAEYPPIDGLSQLVELDGTERRRPGTKRVEFGGVAGLEGLHD